MHFVWFWNASTTHSQCKLLLCGYWEIEDIWGSLDKVALFYRIINCFPWQGIPHKGEWVNIWNYTYILPAINIVIPELFPCDVGNTIQEVLDNGDEDNII